MGVKSLDSFLFRNHNIVGIAPTQDIQLFDVLVKIRTGIDKGFSVYLQNLGSFLLYRRSPQTDFNGQDEDFRLYKELIRKGLKELDKDPYGTIELDENEYENIFKFRVDYEMDITEKISTGTSLGTKVLHYFGGELGRSKTMDYRIITPAYMTIKDDVLHRLFVGESSGKGLWKPDVEKFKLVRNLARRINGGLEMWVVKEKVYSTSFEVNSSQNNFAGVVAAAHEIAPGAEVSLEAKGTQNTNRIVKGKYLIGFRAVRLFYDSEGTLKEWSPSDMGRRRPNFRAGDEESNGFSDPAYHMGGLFEELPSEMDQDTPTTCLDIQQATSSDLTTSDTPEHV